MLLFKLRSEHILTVGKHEIVDLSRPFHHIIKREEGRRPLESMTSTGTPKSYYVEIRDGTYGSLYKIESHGFQSHWVYTTKTSVSDLFRDKALQEMFDRLNEEGTLADIKRHIEIVTRTLINSFDFDVVFTDHEQLTKLNISKEIITQDIKALRISGGSQRHDLVRAILKKHKEIPTRLLDWRILQDLSLRRHTNFDYTPFINAKSVLILTGTNHYYAGWLYRELKKMKIQDILPVALFYTGGRG